MRIFWYKESYTFNSFCMSDTQDLIPAGVPDEPGVPVLSEGAQSVGPEVQAASPDVVASVDQVADLTNSGTALSSLTCPSMSEILDSESVKEFMEKLENAEGVDVFYAADAAAKAYVMDHIVAKLPEDQREIATMVVMNVNFGKAPKDEGRKQYIRLSMVSQMVSRSLISWMVNVCPTKKGPERKFSELEMVELNGGISLANSTDSIYLNWDGMGHDIDDAGERRGKGFTSKWHVVKADDGVDGGFKEVPYKEIWEAEYREMDLTLDGMVESLLALHKRLLAGEEIPGMDADLIYKKINIISC